MKLNIFCVDPDDLPSMLARFEKVGLTSVHVVQDGEWQRQLFFSEDPDPYTPGWLKPLIPLLDPEAACAAVSYFAAFLFSKGERHYVLSYGKSHFFIRPYADYDFGMTLGKRIADPGEARQVSGKRHQGRRKKDIKSFAAGSPLDPESGESVEYLEMLIASAGAPTFGKTGRFGTSAQFTIKDLGVDNLAAFFDAVEDALALPECFSVPRTTIIKDKAEIETYNQELIAELRKPIGEGLVDLATDGSFDLWGVDFVFPSRVSQHELRGPGRINATYDVLTIADLKQYIAANKVADEDISRIKVVTVHDDDVTYRQNLFQALDYIVGKNRMLSQGRWMRFNEDYIGQLDSFLSGIEVEAPEPSVATITGKEGAFNDSNEVKALGYSNQDKNFANIKTRLSTSVELCDLIRNDTLYVVKFGTAQKLGVACDQAINVLEILRNEAALNLENVPSFKRICLWLGYRGAKPLPGISRTKSIILKQKVDLWAHRTREMGYTPVIKLSHHVGKALGTSEMESQEGGGSDSN